MSNDYIDAAALRNMIICADAALQDNISEIDELNVFPVPDGDTGTNMGLTFSAAASECSKRDFSSVGSVAECAASALLRAARGNSGVILSLLFRGISGRLKGLDTASPKELAEAMNEGVSAAYKAVMKPAEGTILTVSRLASSAALKAAQKGADIEQMLERAVIAGESALENTINLNPVLKKAGVVDAGGKGFMVILVAMLQAFRGDFVMPETAKSGISTSANAFSVFATEDITYAFDTVFTVRKKSKDIDILLLRAYLDSIGDSLVIGDDDEVFKVHVHTNIPGDALNEAQKYGTLELAKIENMRLQHDDVANGRKAISTDDLESVETELDNIVAEPEKEFGTVAVCAGAGLEDIFRQLGTDGLVTGGQTMNPSTDDILRVINRVPASTVFVFPNNKNIIMAAEQCIPLTEKKVIVVPTKTVPQGIAAMLNFDPSSAEEEITEMLTECISGIHTAMITYAARDSEFDGHAIHSGEYLALLDGKLLGSYTGISSLFKELSWAFDEFNPEFITVYYGCDVSEEDAEASVETIRGNFPDAEVTVVNGGQPVYYYMISIE